MNALFDEREADREIIESLVKTNRTLWRELESTRSMLKSMKIATKRRNPMSKIFQDQNGALLVAHKVEQLTLEEAQKLAAHLEEDLNRVKAFIERELAPQAQAASEEQPAAPAQPEAPAAPVEQAAPAEAAPAADQSQPAPAPEQPAAPEQPVAPTVDPNAVPAPATPVADPNAVPPLQ